jgi:hypothetical protein
MEILRKLGGALLISRLTNKVHSNKHSAVLAKQQTGGILEQNSKAADKSHKYSQLTLTMEHRRKDNFFLANVARTTGHKRANNN